MSTTQTTPSKAARKSSTKKPATVTKEKKPKEIKYSDKSGGQPELVPIFETLKNILQQFVKGTLQVQDDKPGAYGLVSKKAVEIEGRKRDEVWFAGLMVQKGYVGFYFMPIYADTSLKTVFKSELLKCLKGKSCFHIKKQDPVIFEQVEDALKVGYKLYKDNGWLDD